MLLNKWRYNWRYKWCRRERRHDVISGASRRGVTGSFRCSSALIPAITASLLDVSLAHYYIYDTWSHPNISQNRLLNDVPFTVSPLVGVNNMHAFHNFHPSAKTIKFYVLSHIDILLFHSVTSHFSTVLNV